MAAHTPNESLSKPETTLLSPVLLLRHRRLKKTRIFSKEKFVVSLKSQAFLKICDDFKFSEQKSIR